MKNKELTREEALEQYLAFQIRLFDYLHMFQIASEIKEDKYQPVNPMGHAAREFMETVRTSSLGLFASLIDPQPHALDIFNVWPILFPEYEGKIVELRDRIRPQIQLIKDYRNDVAFHVNKNLRRYFDTRRRFQENGKEIISAMQAFWDLAAELTRNQAKALPDFRNEIDPILRTAQPNLSPEQLEKLKDFFIQNEI